MMPRAKKSFGQNWLVDDSIVQKIIIASEIHSGEKVLEIGPGTGVLTQALVDAGACVTAIEADSSLIPALREKFGDRVELIEGDALSVSHNLQSSTYKLVANIPYNLTSDILRSFLTQEPKPSRSVLMVQKEVAERIIASPPQMSLLSVMCQLYAVCKRVVNVPAGAFRPIPKVDSAVVQLDLLNAKKYWGIEPEEVMQVAKRGFTSRRKQLHKNLATHPDWSSDDVKDALKKMNLDPLARAQTLTVENWIGLTHIFVEKT